MARYIKANPLVAKFLNLENDRNTVKDGNYILWQSDMLAFGSLTCLNETLTAIGAIALMPHEARAEQDGTVIRALPEATDPRFIMPTRTEETPADRQDLKADPETDDENKETNDSNQEPETESTTNAEEQ